MSFVLSWVNRITFGVAPLPALIRILAVYFTNYIVCSLCRLSLCQAFINYEGGFAGTSSCKPDVGRVLEGESHCHNDNFNISSSGIARKPMQKRIKNRDVMSLSLRMRYHRLPASEITYLLTFVLFPWP